MTETEHAELSRRLALALGYAPESVSLKCFGGRCGVYRVDRQYQDKGIHNGPERWHMFDYRQPDVALPVLEWLMRKYDGMLTLNPELGEYRIRTFKPNDSRCAYANTLPEAIARAACAVKGIK